MTMNRIYRTTNLAFGIAAAGLVLCTSAHAAVSDPKEGEVKGFRLMGEYVSVYVFHPGVPGLKGGNPNTRYLKVEYNFTHQQKAGANLVLLETFKMVDTESMVTASSGHTSSHEEILSSVPQEPVVVPWTRSDSRLSIRVNHSPFKETLEWTYDFYHKSAFQDWPASESAGYSSEQTPMINLSGAPAATKWKGTVWVDRFLGGDHYPNEDSGWLIDSSAPYRLGF